MKPLARKMTIAAAGVSLVALLASPLVAGADDGAEASGPLRLADMTQGFGGGWDGRMGMMGSGMNDHGMGLAATGDLHCPSAAGDAVDRDLSADDVRAHLEQSLQRHGNARLKVGDVAETDDDTIIADIVTVDDSLVQRMAIDRHTGQMRSAE